MVYFNSFLIWFKKKRLYNNFFISFLSERKKNLGERKEEERFIFLEM